MDMYIWQGQKVRLRAPEPGDWEAFSTWNYDSYVQQRSYAMPFPKSREAEQKWATERALQRPEGDQFTFVVENLAGEFAGTMNTHSCDRRSGTFKYGLAIKRDHWRRGYASEAVLLVCRYFFRELRYQKVSAHVYSFNEGSIALHERLGFQLEGRLRRMIHTEGRYWDELVFGLTAEEFEAAQGSRFPTTIMLEGV